MIQILVMDVDGTLTDGKLYIGKMGEVFKVFDVKDGCGIKDVLPGMNIIPVTLTARVSEIVMMRCEELGIKYIYQNVKDKRKKLEEFIEELSVRELLPYDFSNVAYIGDDITDLECMMKVKTHGGIVGCPHDAAEVIFPLADFKSSRNAGNGAVREFIDWIKVNMHN